MLLKRSPDAFAELRSLAASQAAERLLGSELISEIGGQNVRVRIVETEAYDQSDTASHSYKGETPRTKVMFGPAGYLYVYFTYGMHYCCNVVVGEQGHGAAVLLRAVEPLEGEPTLAERRSGKTGIELTNGPAKLCQALGIDRRMNGHHLSRLPLRLVLRPPVEASRIVTTTRIGISSGKDVPWRFYLRDSAYVSRK